VFTISGPLRGRPGSLCTFPLRVPHPEIPSRDLVGCVQDRLALPADVAFYFVPEPLPGGDTSNYVQEEALPLTASLPDGSRLRLLVIEETLPAAAAQTGAAAAIAAATATPSAPPAQALAQMHHQSLGTADLNLSSLDPTEHRIEGNPGSAPLLPSQRRPLRKCLWEERPPPGSKEINTDLANERTVLAWARTGLSIIRTVFSFATLGGTSRTSIMVDVAVTIVLSLVGFMSFLVGWQRFLVIRKSGLVGARRLSIRPMMSIFVLVSAVCVAAVIIKQPRRLELG